MASPVISEIGTGEELKHWYWLKQELVDNFKQKQLSYFGAKFDILERNAIAFDKGITKPERLSKSDKLTSKFVWSKSS